MEYEIGNNTISNKPTTIRQGPRIDEKHDSFYFLQKTMERRQAVLSQQQQNTSSLNRKKS